MRVLVGAKKLTSSPHITKYSKSGGFVQAQKDFNSLARTNIEINGVCIWSVVEFVILRSERN